MYEPDWTALTEAHRCATAYLAGLPQRHVGAMATVDQLRAALGGPLPIAPTDPVTVTAQLAAAAEPGLVASQGGRYFGFVIGGSTPAALAADWLTSAWDQNAALVSVSPAAAVVEEVTAGWLTELLGLPADASVGFVTGAQLAHVTCLAAARHEMLRRAGWDVETDGLAGAPRLRVLATAERHSTVDRAMRFLGLGTGALVPIDTDGQGRMRPAALAAALRAETGPVIVCAQAGHINTGAVDPLGPICAAAHEAGAWVHVDGAFGLWGAASPRTAHLLAGVELADSWSTDAHKWLNVPFDSGLAIVAHPAALRTAMGIRASYLIHGNGGVRDQLEHNPEFSRRGRGFAVYAAIRALGRAGIADLVDRCCGLARRFAEQLAAAGAEVLNEVVLNQVLVRFPAPDGADPDAHNQQVVERIQAEGTCWASGTTWRGRAALRISVSNWTTDESDVDASVAAMLRCAIAPVHTGLG
jgi:glutamate/tyrosine decarboxylase-like PLP-dependent enzyme